MDASLVRLCYIDKPYYSALYALSVGCVFGQSRVTWPTAALNLRRSVAATSPNREPGWTRAMLGRWRALCAFRVLRLKNIPKSDNTIYGQIRVSSLVDRFVACNAAARKKPSHDHTSEATEVQQASSWPRPPRTGRLGPAGAHGDAGVAASALARVSRVAPAEKHLWHTQRCCCAPCNKPRHRHAIAACLASRAAEWRAPVSSGPPVSSRPRPRRGTLRPQSCQLQQGRTLAARRQLPLPSPLRPRLRE